MRACPPRSWLVTVTVQLDPQTPRAVPGFVAADRARPEPHDTIVPLRPEPLTAPSARP